MSSVMSLGLVMIAPAGVVACSWVINKKNRIGGRQFEESYGSLI